VAGVERGVCSVQWLLGSAGKDVCCLRAAGKSPSGKLVVDIERYQPISRLGGNTYARVRGLFDLPRPDRGPTQQKLQYSSTAS
jgi:hypothetical protein